MERLCVTRLPALVQMSGAVGKETTNSLPETVAWMRAAGEPTRLRLLALLDQMDLTVSDLITILDQSQPRISRHLKLLVEAGLADRYQEGAWAYFRTADSGQARKFLNAVLKSLAGHDAQIEADNEKLEEVRLARAKRAEDYFARNAEDWVKIRSLHIAEDQVEKAMVEIALAHTQDHHIGSMLDLGTGTGRILQLFSQHVDRGVGVDSSHDMLAFARAALSDSAYQHLQVRHGDVYRLGEGERFDLVVLHQVLHFLEDPALALRHAKRRVSRDGQLLIVDFAPHEFEFLRNDHTHRRLGMSTRQMERWLSFAGLKLERTRTLHPPKGEDTALTVMLWQAVHADDEGFDEDD